MALEATVLIKEGTIFTRLKGELDEETVRDLRQKLIFLLNQYDVRNIVFNLRELSFMDSTGIGLILGRYEYLKQKNGSVILCDLNKNIENIIEMSGLLRVCTLRDSEASARWFLGI